MLEKGTSVMLTSRKRPSYESTVIVTCSDNGKTNTAEVLTFMEGQRLIVSLNRQVRMEMVYNPRNKLYVAHQTGLEFVSSGPKTIDRTPVKRR